jgi:hypothetical protein
MDQDFYLPEIFEQENFLRGSVSLLYRPQGGAPRTSARLPLSPPSTDPYTGQSPPLRSS